MRLVSILVGGGLVEGGGLEGFCEGGLIGGVLVREGFEYGVLGVIELLGLKICIGGCCCCGFFICIWVLYWVCVGICVGVVLVDCGWYIDIGGFWDYEVCCWLEVGDGCGGLL